MALSVLKRAKDRNQIIRDAQLAGSLPSDFDYNAAFEQLKKFDPKLTFEQFDKSFKENPKAVAQVYESVKPRSLVGTQITLPDGQQATVQAIKEGAPGGAANALVTQFVTDKGVFDAYGEDFVNKGFQYEDRGRIFTPTQQHLDAIESGKVVSINRNLFSDLNRTPDSKSDNLVLFAAPVPGYFQVSDPKLLRDDNQGFKLEGLARGENGKLYYAGSNGVSGNGAKSYSLFGERVGLPEGLNARTTTVKKKGGFLGDIGRAVGGVLDNPLVKLGVSAFVPGGAGLVGAFETGKIGGGLVTGQLSFSDALKGIATATAAQGAGSLAKGFSGAVSDAIGGSLGNIAGGAAQGAIRGGVGSLLSGGDLGQGLLSGGLFGAGTTAGSELLGQTGNALDQSKRANQEFFGLNPNAKSPTIDFGNPQNFGPTFDLPNTIGALAGAPSIGGLFDDVEFPGMGLNPNATGLLDLGSGLGQGLTNPTSPNVPGQLGQGLTVGVPGGTLGQGGVTPTGQITLGNPNSFINGGQGSSSGFDVSKLLKGLLGAGTAAAVGNALTRSPQQQQTQQALPVQRFSMNPQTFNYTGDPAKYGETDIGNFQFYKPNLGLLG